MDKKNRERGKVAFTRQFAAPRTHCKHVFSFALNSHFDFSAALLLPLSQLSYGPIQSSHSYKKTNHHIRQEVWPNQSGDCRGTGDRPINCLSVLQEDDGPAMLVRKGA